MTLVVPSLASGGAERVMSRLAEYWAQKGWRVTLITLASDRADFFSLSHLVHRISLGLEAGSRGMLSGIRQNITRVRALRSAILSSNPDAVISFIEKTNILTLLATLRTRPPVVVGERTDPREHQIGWGWSVLRDRLYPRASALVVQTRSVATWAQGKVGPKKVYVIPNAVGQAAARWEGDECDFPRPFVLAIGRFTTEKGFDLLLRAFQQATSERAEWSLVLIGEGSERGALEQLAADLGIAGRVRMPGQREDLGALMHQASIFVLPSRFEGFPNALLEAMAFGLPVVSFNCPSGPSEIINDGVDGILVPSENVSALARAIQDLMDDPGRRAQLGLHARDISQRFSTEKVMKMWEDMLNTVRETHR